MKKIQLALLSVAVISAIGLNANACTGLIVGKDASSDGSIIIARNEDYGITNWNKYLAYRPAQNNTDSQWDLGNGLVVPMPAKFLAYSAMPDWNANTKTPDGRYFEERGINEFNVAVSATTSAEANKKAMEVDPFTGSGVIEANIPALVLSQAQTAKEGVNILGKYIEEFGAGEANSLYIADIKEVWLMEIGSGHHWIAVKVPNDSYAMMANGLRIHGVDLHSSDVLHSKNLFRFTKQHHLLKHPKHNHFNFAKAFGVIGDLYNIDREWLGQEILSPSLSQEPRQKQYPLFLKPDEKISVANIDKVLSATYEGTELEYDGKRPIKVPRQLETHIIQLRADMPYELQGLIWQSYGILDDSVLMPIYATLHHYPKPYSAGTDNYSDNSAFWQFRALSSMASINKELYEPVLHKMWSEKEDKLYNEVSDLDQALKYSYDMDPQGAIKMASEYSSMQLKQTYKQAKKLRFKMMTMLTKSAEKHYSKEEFDKIMKL